MKFLKSYTGALVVLAAVIVLSAPLGCLRSVNAQRAQVLELFAQGGQGDGGSVASDLQDRIGTAAKSADGGPAVPGRPTEFPTWKGPSPGRRATPTRTRAPFRKPT